jgi:predicted Zn-dependent protease
MSFLDKAGISARGMMEFFEKLQGQEMLPTEQQSQYVRTHPLTQDRIDAVRHHYENSVAKDAKLPEKFYVMHERMKAKLMGFLQPETALLRYTDKDPRISARYARAIALYRTSHIDNALTLLNDLLKEEPANPFFYEMKGQILLENGRVDEAITCYATANKLLPDSSLLRASYGHALLEQRTNPNIDLAVHQLEEANRLEERVPYVWHLLASAWGRKAELTKNPVFEGMATYALAEEAAARGNDSEAGQLASRAMKVLPKNSTYWLHAQDIKLTTSPDDEGGGKKDKKDKK